MSETAPVALAQIAALARGFAQTYINAGGKVPPELITFEEERLRTLSGIEASCPVADVTKYANYLRRGVAARNSEAITLVAQAAQAQATGLQDLADRTIRDMR